MMNDSILKFHYEIEEIVKKGSNYIDAIVHWCKVHELEIEVVAEMIKKDQMAKMKIEEEAERLNFLKTKGVSRLPL